MKHQSSDASDRDYTLTVPRVSGKWFQWMNLAIFSQLFLMLLCESHFSDTDNDSPRQQQQQQQQQWQNLREQKKATRSSITTLPLFRSFWAPLFINEAFFAYKFIINIYILLLILWLVSFSFSHKQSLAYCLRALASCLASFD